MAVAAHPAGRGPAGGPATTDAEQDTGRYPDVCGQHHIGCSGGKSSQKMHTPGCYCHYRIGRVPLARGVAVVVGLYMDAMLSTSRCPVLDTLWLPPF